MFQLTRRPWKVEIREGYHIEHPNQEKARIKATKAVVSSLLLAPSALMLIVTSAAGRSWPGAKIVLIGYMLVYVLMAYYVGRWNRGVLPLAAALAIILGIFAGDRRPAVVRARQGRLHARRRSTRASSASSRC